MAKTTDSQVSFSGGEFSPKLDARIDQEKYRLAGRHIENMIPLKEGPLTRRPGTQFIDSCKTGNTPTQEYGVRLIKFIYSPTTTFMLEVGHKYIRFYSNGQQVNITSAPAYSTFTNYPAGQFVSYGGLFYYNTVVGNSGPSTPDLDYPRWIQQSILEVPTPYSSVYTPGTSEYTTDIWKIAVCQINDVVYFAHPNYPVYKLTRITDTNWTFQQAQFLTPPLLDQNATNTTLACSSNNGSITITASAPAWVGSNYYTAGNSVEVSGVIYNCVVSHVSSVFASDLALGYWTQINVFYPQHINSYWQIATLRSSATIEVDAASSSSAFSLGASSPIQALGSWEVHTYGVWSATFAIERSLDGGVTWDAVRTITGKQDRNVDINGTAEVTGLYRINVLSSSAPTTPGASVPRIVFECVDAYLYGLVQITGYTDAYHATAQVVEQLYDNNPLATPWSVSTSYSVGNIVSYGTTNYTCTLSITGGSPPPSNPGNWTPNGPTTEFWSEGAWSDYRGYPQAVASYQQRVIYAATAYEPQRIWGSVTNDIENFALGDQTLATDSFKFDLNAPSRGPIVWLCAQNNLFAGFSGAEWVISGSGATTGGSIGGTITPTSIQAVEHSTWGSIFGVNPLNVGDGVLFLQRQANQIRQMLFSVYTEKYMSQSLTTYSSHLFNSGIAQLDYQPMWRGQSELWAITQQGQLCGMTYEMDQNVFGWHRHTTGTNTGLPDANYPDLGFESVACLYGQGYQDDEVWVVANRYASFPQWNASTRYYSQRDVYAFNTTVSYNGGHYLCITPAPNYSVLSSTTPDLDTTNWLSVSGYAYGQRYIERFNPNNWEQVFTSAPNAPQAVVSNAFYVDSGQTITSPGSTTITGLDHLANRWVVGLADGAAFGPILVGNGVNGSAYGSVTLPVPFAPNLVQIGLPVAYSVQAMRYDADQRQGNTQGLVKQISDVFIRVYNSLGGNIANKASGPNAWVANNTYTQGAQVSYNGVYYQCTVGSVTSSVPPPSDAASWRPYGGYLALPVPIPYGNIANPFSSPQQNLITTPTDIRITPQLNLTPDTDPIIIVTGNDALPLTVIALIIKYDVIATP